MRHFTYPDLVAAADAAGIKPKKAVKNLVKTFKAASKDRKKATDGAVATPQGTVAVPDAVKVSPLT